MTRSRGPGPRTPFAFVGDLRGVLDDTGPSAALLAHPVVMQLVLNVALFVPLGILLRVLGGRGLLTAAAVGLTVSALIETTQLTGVWGLYDCAYRVFDVDDLLMNTTGAVLGSILALSLPRSLSERATSADADRPRPVTRGRRLLAMLVDWTTLVLLGATVAVVVQAVLLYVLHDRATALGTDLPGTIANWTMLAAFTLVVLGTGRSPGDLAVRLRWSGGRFPTPVTRLLRLVGGAAGYVGLGMLPGGWSALAWGFALLALLLVLTSAHGRGLPGVLSGQQLEDSRS